MAKTPGATLYTSNQESEVGTRASVSYSGRGRARHQPGILAARVGRERASQRTTTSLDMGRWIIARCVRLHRTDDICAGEWIWNPQIMGSGTIGLQSLTEGVANCCGPRFESNTQRLGAISGSRNCRLRSPLDLDVQWLPYRLSRHG